MLKVLTDYITGILVSRTEAALAKRNHSRSIQRIFLTNLVELYDAMDLLISASIRVASEFEGIARGTEVPTKIVCFSRLEKLHKAFQFFLEKAKRISQVLEIYGPDFALTIANSTNLKFAYWERVVLTEFLLPVMLTDGDEKKTYQLRTPSEIPTELEILDPDFAPETKKRKIEEAIEKLKSDLSFVEVDVRELQRDDPLILSLNEAIDSSMEARDKLSEFIRSNYSLEDLLKTDAERHTNKYS